MDRFALLRITAEKWGAVQLRPGLGGKYHPIVAYLFVTTERWAAFRRTGVPGMKSDRKSRLWLRALPPFLAALPLASVCAHAAEEPVPQISAAEQAKPSPRDSGPGLDSEGRRLAKVLELTEAQQAELVKILTGQREQIRTLWRDQKVPPEYRVSQMQAIHDQTEERIRALLTDEQKKKYVSSHPREPSKTSQRSDLEHWLNAQKAK